MGDITIKSRICRLCNVEIGIKKNPLIVLTDIYIKGPISIL